jgi:hypothetical protein
LRRLNQCIVWCNGLRSVLHVEIGAKDDFVVITFGPLSEANPRNSVRLSTAPKETASSGRNDREKSDRSKKRRSTPGSKADSDQAMHARIIPLIRDFEISFGGMWTAVKSSVVETLEA